MKGRQKYVIWFMCDYVIMSMLAEIADLHGRKWIKTVIGLRQLVDGLCEGRERRLKY